MLKSCLKRSPVKLHPHCAWLSFSQGKQNLEVTGETEQVGGAALRGSTQGPLWGGLVCGPGTWGQGWDASL